MERAGEIRADADGLQAGVRELLCFISLYKITHITHMHTEPVCMCVMTQFYTFHLVGFFFLIIVLY